LAAFSFSSLSESAPTDSIDGLWMLEQDHTVIEIQTKGDSVEGVIFSRPAGKKNEVDKFNPTPELRNRSILGLRVLENLKNTKVGYWKGGRIYDPDSGSFYSAQARLKDSETLIVRGYIAIPLFGRTAVLKRYQGKSLPLSLE